MKKAVKILSIILLVIVLVSAVFVASGSSCVDNKKWFYTTVYLYDAGYGGVKAKAEIDGYYEGGKVVLTFVGVNITAGKHVPLAKKYPTSTLDYSKSQKGFYKSSVALIEVGNSVSDLAEYITQNTYHMKVVIKSKNKSTFKSGSELTVSLPMLSHGWDLRGTTRI